MKQLFFISFLFSFSLNGLAVNPDIIVLQSGESLKVYNIEITSGNNIYYTLEEDEESLIQKVSKDNVLIIKKADGTRIDPSLDNVQNNENSDLKKNKNLIPSITFESLNSIISTINAKEGSNMTIEEMKRYMTSTQYDIIFDFSESDINHFKISDFLQYFITESGIPPESLLSQFENKIVQKLNEQINDYKFYNKDEESNNEFIVIVKFKEITEKAQSKGYIVILDKISGNLAYRKLETRPGRWNNFETLLMEDAEFPFVNAPDKFSINSVSQGIEYTTWKFRKSGTKTIKKRNK